MLLSTLLILLGVLLVFVAYFLFRYAFIRLPSITFSDQIQNQINQISDHKIIRQGFDEADIPSHLDTIIIGSGTGGLMCASLLARAGHKVLILEQHDVIGGCTHVFPQDSKSPIPLPNNDNTSISSNNNDNSLSFSFDSGLHYIGGSVWEINSLGRRLFDAMTNSKVDWAPMHEKQKENNKNNFGAYDLFAVMDVKSIIQKALNNQNESSDIQEAKEEKENDPKIKSFEFPMTNNNEANLIKAFPLWASKIKLYFYHVQSATRAAGPWFVEKVVSKSISDFLYKYGVLKPFNYYVSNTVDDIMKEIGLYPSESNSPESPESPSAPGLKELYACLTYLCGDYGLPPSKAPFFIHAVVAKHYQDGAGYPIGGSERIAIESVRQIMGLGGRAWVRANVDEIIIEEGRACGVKMKRGGQLIKAKNIISAAGAINTYTKLLKNNPLNILPDTNWNHNTNAPNKSPVNLNENKDSPLASTPRYLPPPSVCHIYLFAGFEGSPSSLNLPSYNTWLYSSLDVNACSSAHLNVFRPSNVNINIEKGMSDKGVERVYDSKSNNHLNENNGVNEFDIASALGGLFISFSSAKDPKVYNNNCNNENNSNVSTALIVCEGRYEWFLPFIKSENERKGPEAYSKTKPKQRLGPGYKELKRNIAQAMLSLLYSRWPQLKSKIRYIDVGTPLSAEYYLNSIGGSSYGLEHSSTRFLDTDRILRPKTEIEGLYLTGQDIATCGVMGAMIGGVMTAVSIDTKVLFNLIKQ